MSCRSDPKARGPASRNLEVRSVGLIVPELAVLVSRQAPTKHHACGKEGNYRSKSRKLKDVPSEGPREGRAPGDDRHCAVSATPKPKPNPTDEHQETTDAAP